MIKAKKEKLKTNIMIIAINFFWNKLKIALLFVFRKEKAHTNTDESISEIMNFKATEEKRKWCDMEASCQRRE